MQRNRRRGGAIAGIILTIMVLAVLGAITLGSVGFYVADHSRVTTWGDREGRDGTTLETPFGSVRVREHAHLDPAALGMPVYPGAERVRDSQSLASFHF